MIEITWLGHGTAQVRLESGEVLLFDPWTEGNPRFPQDHRFDRVDAMLISHGHFDHIHDAIPIAGKFEPKVFAIYETGLWLEKKGVKNICAMNKGGSQAGPGGIVVTMTHAVHSCGILDGDQILYGGEASGYVVRLPDSRAFYFAGDTNVFSDMALIQELYHPDLAFLPMGDLFTMGPREAAKAARLLGVRKIVPMHHGTFPALTGTPAALAGLLAGSGMEVLEAAPGTVYRW
jgi:L-ascorbate metabolism protein UlaG (beta-lactamase superfamily)